MDITKLNVVDLKALAYDEIIKLEAAQANIRTINQELVKRQEAAKESKSEEPKLV